MDEIEDWDEIPVYPFTVEELETQPNGGDDVFFRRSLEMIDIGFNNGMDKITLFRIFHGDQELFLNLPSSSWVATLEDAMVHFEKMEEYEECAYARDLLNRITD
jgi:hypothetical protein